MIPKTKNHFHFPSKSVATQYISIYLPMKSKSRTSLKLISNGIGVRVRGRIWWGEWNLHLSIVEFLIGLFYFFLNFDNDKLHRWLCFFSRLVCVKKSLSIYWLPLDCVLPLKLLFSSSWTNYGIFNTKTNNNRQQTIDEYF